MPDPIIARTSFELRSDSRPSSPTNVRTMSEMFAGCKALTWLDVSKFNTSKVTSMYRMFADCKKLGSLDLRSFDTGRLEINDQDNLPGSNMFNGCSALTSVKVGSKYRIPHRSIVPPATNKSGKWWSYQAQKWVTPAQIASSRSKVADTYTSKKVAKHVSVQYCTHRQSYGWEAPWAKCDGQKSGTMGEYKRLEAIKIRLVDRPVSGGIEYKSHVQTYGWEKSWRRDGSMSGTSGQSKRLEAIRIRLYGDMAKKYDVYYRAHAQHFGWMGWAKNGASAGTAGYYYRLEAIQIVLVPKGGKAPGATYNGATQSTKTPFLKK